MAGRALPSPGSLSQDCGGDGERGHVDEQHAPDPGQREQRCGEQWPERFEAVGADAEGGVGGLEILVVDHAGYGAACGGGEGGGGDAPHRDEGQQHREGRQGGGDREHEEPLDDLAADHHPAQPVPVPDQAGHRPEQARDAVACQQQQRDGDRRSRLGLEVDQQRHQAERVAEDRDGPGRPQHPELAVAAEQAERATTGRPSIALL